MSSRERKNMKTKLLQDRSLSRSPPHPYSLPSLLFYLSLSLSHSLFLLSLLPYLMRTDPSSPTLLFLRECSCFMMTPFILFSVLVGKLEREQMARGGDNIVLPVATQVVVAGFGLSMAAISVAVSGALDGERRQKLYGYVLCRSSVADCLLPGSGVVQPAIGMDGHSRCT